MQGKIRLTESDIEELAHAPLACRPHGSCAQPRGRFTATCVADSTTL